MEENKNIQQPGPIDIPDAAQPTRTDSAAKPRPAAAKPKAAAKPGAAAKPRPAGTAPAKKGAKKAVKRKPAPAAQEDDLPVWLQKVVDWAADLPEKLKRLPGKLKTLPGKFRKLWGSWFYRVYFPLVALALIAMIIGWRWLDGFAADYESAQPVHVADQVAALFAQGDYDRLYELDAAAQELSGGDRAFYVDSLSQLAAGKSVDCMQAFSSNKDVLNYTVTLDGQKFASFTLVPSGQTTAHNNTLWRLGTVTTHVALESQVTPADPNMAPYRVRALPEYAVTVDGRPLSAEDVTQTGIALLPEDFLPEGVTAPTLTEYGFYSENDVPQIAVAAPDGTALTPVEETPGIWVCGPREDEAMKAQFTEGIVKTAQRIAKYTTQDVSRNAALDNVLSGSPAEETIKKFNNGWAPSHKEERFEDMEVSDFWVLSEDCLVCHVKFTYILTSRRQNNYPYPTDYTFCVLRRNGEGRLYNLLFH